MCVCDKTGSNQDESKNSIVWTRCPNRLSYGIYSSRISICDALYQFNDDACKETVSRLNAKNLKQLKHSPCTKSVAAN